MSGLINQEIQELFQLLHDDHVFSYNAVASTCLFLYEILITFPKEVRHVWRSSWSFVTALHVLIRYYTLAFLIINTYVSISARLSPEFCNWFDIFQVWGGTVLVPAVDILIITRVYALYNQKKTIGAVLVLCWLTETTIILSETGLGFGSNKSVMPDPLPGILPGCFPLDAFHSHSIVRTGAIAIAFQAVYLGLALYKLATQMKNFQLLRSMTPLLRTFFRDGALFCLNILLMYALNVLFVTLYPNGPLQGVGEVWLVAIVSITAGRLVLNLRSSVQSDDCINSCEPYEMQSTTDNHGQFSSVIVFDPQRMSNTPHSADPYFSFLP